MAVVADEAYIIMRTFASPSPVFVSSSGRCFTLIAGQDQNRQKPALPEGLSTPRIRRSDPRGTFPTLSPLSDNNSPSRSAAPCAPFASIGTNCTICGRATLSGAANSLLAP
jgi:hypothetical protein